MISDNLLASYGFYTCTVVTVSGTSPHSLLIASTSITVNLERVTTSDSDCISANFSNYADSFQDNPRNFSDTIYLDSIDVNGARLRGSFILLCNRALLGILLLGFLITWKLFGIRFLMEIDLNWLMMNWLRNFWVDKGNFRLVHRLLRVGLDRFFSLIYKTY